MLKAATAKPEERELAEKRKKPGYVGVLLDDDSVAKLRALAVHKILYCHHLTIVYDPDTATRRRYRGKEGTTVRLIVTGIARDERGQAVYLQGVQSKKKFPHVTISCVEGTPPEYSDELLKAADAEGAIEPFEMQLSGVVRFVQL